MLSSSSCPVSVVRRDGSGPTRPLSPRVAREPNPAGFGSRGGPGSRPRPPPSRRLPRLSPGRGARRGSRPRARRPSEPDVEPAERPGVRPVGVRRESPAAARRRARAEHIDLRFETVAPDDVLATAGVRSKPAPWQTRRPPPAGGPAARQSRAPSCRPQRRSSGSALTRWSTPNAGPKPASPSGCRPQAGGAPDAPRLGSAVD